MLNFLFFVEKLCELCKLWDKIQRNVLLGEIWVAIITPLNFETRNKVSRHRIVSIAKNSNIHT